MRYGIYRGHVTNVDDPEHLYRIKAIVPQVFGESTETEWAWPCFPPGWDNGLLQAHADPDGSLAHVLQMAVPKNGSGVWIMFEGGDPVAPVWVGTWRRA